MESGTRLTAIATTSARGYYTADKADRSKPRILITGGLGQLGLNLARILRSSYGQENVLLSDIKKPEQNMTDVGPFVHADILNKSKLRELVVNHDITWLIHFSALLSAVGEMNMDLAVQINLNGLNNVFDVAREHQLRLFVPSTIGAFGANSPRNPTPDDCIQQPNTIYGVSKVFAELMGMYLNHRYKLDFRSLRLPGVISPDVEPGGGTTDYAIHLFKYAIRGAPYKCYLNEETMLPMIYIDDCLRGIHEVMTAPIEKLNRRVYNLAGVSFNPVQLVAAVRKGMDRHGLGAQKSGFQVTYKSDFRQAIADTWPMVFDDSNARKDWNWKHHVDLDGMVDKMFDYMKKHP